MIENNTFDYKKIFTQNELEKLEKIKLRKNNINKNKIRIYDRNSDFKSINVRINKKLLQETKLIVNKNDLTFRKYIEYALTLLNLNYKEVL